MYSQIVSDPLIGTLFAERYLINFLVARGGMGNIYQANDTKLGRVIAVKTLRPEFSDDPVILRRFERESNAISNLKHHNICQFYDSGVTVDGIHYFTMEYLEGHALDKLLKEKHILSPETAIEYMIQVTAGLCDAHDHGIVHRDLKPANIFIVHEPDAHDHIKVLDFGVAKVNDDILEIQEKLTRAGSTLGTPYYMSPEQIQGLEVDGRTDIYALGVILWECVFGQPVFQGKTLIEIFSAASNNKIPKLPQSVRNSKLWQKLYDVLCKALQKDRDKRYSSMHAFRRALEDILETESAKSLKTPRSLPIWRNVSSLGTKIDKALHSISPLKLVLIGSIICIAIGSIVATIVFLIPRDVEIQKSHFETYKFSSDVPAKVLLNGDVIGKTPMSIDLTQEPPFEIRFQADDLPEQAFDIDKKSTDITSYMVNLNPNKIALPEIHLETVPPDAEVFVDGVHLPGKTPVVIEVPERRNKIYIKISLDGYQTENLVVVPNGGDVKMKTNLFRRETQEKK